MNDLILEYKRTLKAVNRAYRKADSDDKKAISGMISDLEYAIEWLESGRRPKHKRGIERRAAYERERPMDPLIMQSYFANQTVGNVGIREEDRMRIDEALSTLTVREREVYEIYKGGGLSYSTIAGMFCVSRSAIQDTVERAEKKVTKQLNENLFCLVM